MVNVKICGLKTPETLQAAIDAGADFVGFNFYLPSPRYIDPDRAAKLSAMLPEGVRKVGLFVDPDDDLLRFTLEQTAPDMIQLHGSETPERVSEVIKMTGISVMKALRIATIDDLDHVGSFEPVCDWLLLDSKPSTGEREILPGGTGQTFDWSLLKNFRPTKSWMLAGGLTPENVGVALSFLKPDAVDVSSGVETAPGQKDPEKIRAFIEAVKSA